MLYPVFKLKKKQSNIVGALPNLLLIVPEKTIKLSVNDYMRCQLAKDGKVTTKNQLVAAATAGFFQVCFVQLFLSNNNICFITTSYLLISLVKQ